MVALTFAFTSRAAIPSVPKASAAALGATKGKPFNSGLVFINGKYVAPPYQVERWGNGIRINGRNATGPVIEWEEFLKTQSGVKVSKSGGVAESAAPAAAPAEQDVESSLDDLFEDEPDESAEQKKTKRKPKAPPKPKVTYTLEGDFTPNAASKALVQKINAVRTDIDARLRGNGFVFFGAGYSRVAGDATTAEALLRRLPELMRTKNSVAEFTAAVRAAGFVFLNERVCADLFRNRVDYPRLQERHEHWKTDAELDTLIRKNGQAY